MLALAVALMLALAVELALDLEPAVDLVLLALVLVCLWGLGWVVSGEAGVGSWDKLHLQIESEGSIHSR